MPLYYPFRLLDENPLYRMLDAHLTSSKVVSSWDPGTRECVVRTPACVIHIVLTQIGRDQTGWRWSCVLGRGLTFQGHCFIFPLTLAQCPVPSDVKEKAYAAVKSDLMSKFMKMRHTESLINKLKSSARWYG